MIAFLSFNGRIRRGAYALASCCVFFAQHLAVLIAFKGLGQPLTMDWRFWFTPLRLVANLNGASPVAMSLALAAMLLVTWVLVALAFRRATDACASGWLAAWVVAPIIQVPLILVLSVLPHREGRPTPDGAPQSAKSERPWAAVQGALAGAGLTVVAVAVGALMFGQYGYGMFVVSPFVIGLLTAYLANRDRDIGGVATIVVVVWAMTLGGLALIGLALEGVVCLIMAAPLAFGAALVGAMPGRAMARARQGPAKHVLMSVALLPAMFATEHALPSPTRFETVESVDIAAAPHSVWQSLVRMGPITEPPSVPFRLGLAYPIDGQIIGEGAGAIRRGMFSTGVAYERVTVWSPDRRLAFLVLSDPPMLRELSPYAHVHAPHVTGYFHTGYASFTITPMAGGHSRLTLLTSHELNLDPAQYWLPFAKWAVHSNKIRVLDHFRRQAEEALNPPERRSAG